MKYIGLDSCSSNLSRVKDCDSLRRTDSNLFHAMQVKAAEHPLSVLEYSKSFPSMRTIISYKVIVAGGRANK